MFKDIRYAARVLSRRPGFTIAAVLSLILGIGANTAVFSLLNALLLQNLPIARPHELLKLVEPNRETSTVRESFAYPNYDQIRRNTRVLSDVIMMTDTVGNAGRIIDRGEEQTAFIQMVSDNYFDVLGVPAARGRVLHAADSSTDSIAIISDAFWRRYYGGKPDVLGEQFEYGNRQFTVAGIVGPEFRGMTLDTPTDIWVAFEQTVPANSDSRVRGRWLQIMARVQTGQSAASADAEASSFLTRPVQFQPGGTGYSTLRGQLKRPLLLLELVVVLVMLLTCANLANLVLAGNGARVREFSVRLAIGASRYQLVKQLITESVILAFAGGALAIALAYWMSMSLLSFLSPQQAKAIVNLQFAPGLRVLGFAAALSLFTCVSCGLIPALRSTRPPTRNSERNWMSRGLIISEVAMCTLVLIVAGLFVRTVQNLRSQDVGYAEGHLLVADVGFPRQYSEPQRDQLIEELRRQAVSLPGVEAAAFSFVGQLSGRGIEYNVHTLSSPDKHEMFEQRVSPGFLSAMGTRLSAGRDFTDQDDERSAPVAIVNRAFVRQMGLDSNPVGQRFVKEGGSTKVLTIEIVGMVADSKFINLRNESPAMYYIPYRQNSGSPTVRMAIRSNGDLKQLGARLVDIGKAVDRRMTLANVVPFEEIVNQSLMTERLVAQVSGAFGILALLIASIGSYGVLAYAVVRRTREIGVRIAVGAPPLAIEWMILRESLALLVAGFGIGLPAAIAVSRLVSTMLFGLKPQDPLTIGATLLILTAATVSAAYLPAHRAAKTDPIVALRQE